MCLCSPFFVSFFPTVTRIFVINTPKVLLFSLVDMSLFSFVFFPFPGNHWAIYNSQSKGVTGVFYGHASFSLLFGFPAVYLYGHVSFPLCFFCPPGSYWDICNRQARNGVTRDLWVKCYCMWYDSFLLRAGTATHCNALQHRGRNTEILLYVSCLIHVTSNY